MQSYNRPAMSWGNPPFPNNPAPNLDPRQGASSTAPPRSYVQPYPPPPNRLMSPQSYHVPPSLTPGGGPSPISHKQDFLFQPPHNTNINAYHSSGHTFAPTMHTPSMYPPHRQYTHSTPPISAPPIPPHPAEQYHRPRSLTTPTPPRVLRKPQPALPLPPDPRPKIPPKIPLYSQSVQFSARPPPAIPLYPQPIQTAMNLPTPQFSDEKGRRPADELSSEQDLPADNLPAEEDHLAFALAMSAVESRERQKLLSQEKEDLARGLEESASAKQEEEDLARALSASLASSPSNAPSASTLKYTYTNLQNDNQSSEVGPSTYRSKPGSSVYHSKPEPSTYHSKPEPSAYHSKPGPSAYHPKPELPTYHSKTELPTHHSKPELPTYHSKPELPTYHSEPELPIHHSKPELATRHSKPELPTYHSKPQFPTYHSESSALTSGAGPSAYPSESMGPGASGSTPRGLNATYETADRIDRTPPVLSTIRTVQISEDEAYARRLLLQEEEEEEEEEEAVQVEASEEDHSPPAVATQPRPPLYRDIMIHPANTPPDTSRSSRPSLTSSPAATSPPLQPDPVSAIQPATLHLAASPVTPPATILEVSSLRRSVSATSTSSVPSSRGQPGASFPVGASSPQSVSDDGPSPLIPKTSNANTSSPRRPSTASGVPSLRESENGPSSEPPSPVPHVNHYIDPDLLRGVSIGFTTPSISNSMAVMQGGMPNIITLSFGRCRPLHIQAPTWRHLLKLMARMSTTRVEPTVEAMSLFKGEFKLRTVVQFVKVYHSSTDWRTILWFTIDHPVPPAAPGASKYTNGDVSVLPWSYTLSNLPALLRDGADTAMSKFYTIPSTQSTPYPSLPIDFPNMAMYLQAALDESRRAMHDSTGGIRKLAKMVDSCYPHERSDDASNGPERTTVSGLFKRVIGRGNNRRGVNEDTYELVTPFVSEDWG